MISYFSPPFSKVIRDERIVLAEETGNTVVFSAVSDTKASLSCEFGGEISFLALFLRLRPGGRLLSNEKWRRNLKISTSFSAMPA